MTRAAGNIRRAEPEIPADAPAALVPYLRAIGAAKTAELILAFGGSQIYLAGEPRADGRLARVLGEESVRALGREFGVGQRLAVPLAKAWLARRLAADGVAVAEIARILRVTEATARGYMQRGPDPRQPRLF